MLTLQILCILATPGVLLTLLTLREAILDRRALIAARANGLRSIVANDSVRREACRLICHCMIVASLVSLIPHLDRLQALPNWDSIFLRNLGVVLASYAMTINSLLDLRSRRRVIEKLHQLEGKP